MFQQGAPVLSLKTSLVAPASLMPVSDFKNCIKMLIKNQFWAKISISNQYDEICGALKALKLLKLLLKILKD